MDSSAIKVDANSMLAATLPEGIKESLPIVVSYVPVALAFGMNAARLGVPPLERLFFSCIIYAGASQFVITTLLVAGSSLWVAALPVMAMGPALVQAFYQGAPDES